MFAETDTFWLFLFGGLMTLLCALVFIIYVINDNKIQEEARKELGKESPPPVSPRYSPQALDAVGTLPFFTHVVLQSRQIPKVGAEDFEKLRQFYYERHVLKVESNPPELELERRFREGRQSMRLANRMASADELVEELLEKVSHGEPVGDLDEGRLTVYELNHLHNLLMITAGTFYAPRLEMFHFLVGKNNIEQLIVKFHPQRELYQYEYILNGEQVSDATALPRLRAICEDYLDPTTRFLPSSNQPSG